VSIDAFSFTDDELIYYRDQLRNARYAALADAEAFDQICWAIESLGRRLAPEATMLAKYEKSFIKLVDAEAWHSGDVFTPSFKALFERIRQARNDAAHTGVYARHATSAAIDFSLLLESALMNKTDLVHHHMVREVVTCSPRNYVAQARNLMLKNSFSYLPIFIDNQWCLLSDMAIARFRMRLREQKEVPREKSNLAVSIQSVKDELELIKISEKELVRPEQTIKEILSRHTQSENRPSLWLVVESPEDELLQGILSPFELL